MTIRVGNADSLAAIAGRVFPGGEVRRFFEILDANPELDVFDDLPAGLELNLPSVEQIERYAAPALASVANAIGGAKGFLGQVEGTITQISSQLPTELQGYAREALDLVGEANGVIGQAETVLSQAEESLRDYGGELTNLVSWLLSGKQ